MVFWQSQNRGFLSPEPYFSQPTAATVQQPPPGFGAPVQQPPPQPQGNLSPQPPQSTPTQPNLLSLLVTPGMPPPERTTSLSLTHLLNASPQGRQAPSPTPAQQPVQQLAPQPMQPAGPSAGRSVTLDALFSMGQQGPTRPPPQQQQPQVPTHGFPPQYQPYPQMQSQQMPPPSTGRPPNQMRIRDPEALYSMGQQGPTQPPPQQQRYPPGYQQSYAAPPQSHHQEQFYQPQTSYMYPPPTGGGMRPILTQPSGMPLGYYAPPPRQQPGHGGGAGLNMWFGDGVMNQGPARPPPANAFTLEDLEGRQ